ncbi:MAG: TolC family protein [Bacteroidetes bacterium]|nr:TolC family protein [Bacteroidota bacterium]
MIKIKRTKALLAFFALVFQSTAWAQDTGQAMSLKDCIVFSLKNHPSIKAAGYDEEAANKKATEALSYYLPQITATGTMDDNLKRMTTVIPAGALGPKDTKVQFGNQYTSNVFGQLDQVIFDQSLLTGIKASRPNSELAALQKAKVEDEVAYNTIMAFYQVVVQREQLDLLAENEKKISELLRIQQNRLEKGIIQPLDVNRVKVNYNNTLAKQKSCMNSYELAMNQLRISMGMDAETPLVINETFNYDSVKVYDEQVQMDVNNALDYQIQMQTLKLKEIDLDRNRASVLPKVSAYARYGAQTFNNTFSEQFKNLYDYSVVGVKLSVPIFSSMKLSSQIQQSELNLNSAREKFEVTTNNLQLAIANAYSTLKTSENTLEINKQNLDLAKEVFDNTNLQYQQGVTSLSDLLNAQYAWQEAQNNYISSLLTYCMNRLNLEKSKGTLRQYIEQL